MRPITNLFAATLLTAVILICGGWLSSSVSPKAEPVGPVTDVTHNGLMVEVSGVRNAKGQIVVTIYDNAEALARYDDEDYVDYKLMPAAEGTLIADFPALTEGPYAVSVFHDENSDLKFGIYGYTPLEGYGTSGAAGPYDEPPFDRAAVSPGKVRVEMYYLR